MWTKKNTNHVLLFFILRANNQIEADFSNTGKIKMSQLMFYKKSDSVKQRRLKAKPFAKQLHDYYMDEVSAIYEDEEETYNSSVSALVKMLTARDRTVLDLATLIDNLFYFWFEAED